MFWLKEKSVEWVIIFCFIGSANAITKIPELHHNPSSNSSQQESEKPVRKNLYKLILIDGRQYPDISLNSVSGDTIRFSNYVMTYTTFVDSISRIIQVKEAKALRGGLIGFGGGALIGFIVAIASHDKKKESEKLGDYFSDTAVVVGPIAGGFWGGIIGTGIGLALGKDTVYDFSKLSRTGKLTLLKVIIGKK